MTSETSSIISGVTLERLENMTRGWFVGNFMPAAFRTGDAEIAVQRFTVGDKEPAHLHKMATEITLLLSGRAIMAGVNLVAGDIITLAPGTVSSFEALEDCITVVVKHPGVLNDKFMVAQS